eukprot:TRINITY_DN10323_c0_g1_i2.p1 TRINITY_DN10323_c0_g1~~TRINITY_DN10323_c0_g1_i2.p1  ORF type:complete len:327 (-),score=14.13 TRINITY_DN10323_c0_g1_i2:10-990(-)
MKTLIVQKLNHLERDYSRYIAYVYALLYCLLFTMVNITVKTIPSAGALQIFFNRNLLLAIIHVFINPMFDAPLFVGHISRKAQAACHSRGYLGFAAIGLTYYAVCALPISIATTLFQTSPMWTGIMSWLLVGEQFTIFTFGNIILCFLGVLFICRPGVFGISISIEEAGVLSVIGIIACLGSSFTRSLVDVLVRKGGKSIHVLTYGFYYALCGTFLSVPFMIYDYRGLPTFKDHLLIVFITVLGLLANTLQARAFQLERAAKVSIINYTQIVFTVIADMILFDRKIHTHEVIGMILICSCAVFNICLLYTSPSPRDRQKSRMPSSA